MTVYELYEQLEKSINQGHGELDIALGIDSGTYFVEALSHVIDENLGTYVSISGGTS